MSDHDVEWLDADGFPMTAEEALDVGQVFPAPPRRRAIVGVAAAVAAVTGLLIASNSNHHRRPTQVALRSAVPPTPLPAVEPLSSMLQIGGSFSRADSPAAAVTYMAELQNVTRHGLGPIGEIDVLFPYHLQGTVDVAEIIPGSDKTVTAREPIPPLSTIPPGATVQVRVSFQWECTPESLAGPHTVPSGLAAPLQVRITIGDYQPAVYPLDAATPPGEDALSVARTACGPVQ